MTIWSRGSARVRPRELPQRPPRLDVEQRARRCLRVPRRRPRRRAGQHRLRRAPHPLARPHEPRPLVPRARPPRVERRARRGQVGRQVEAGPVREAVARHRLDREQLEHLAERRARLREQRLEHPRHRQQRRAGVPRVPARRHAPALPAGGGARLEHADRVARRGEPDRGREPAHARADHDDLHRSRRQSAGAATAPIAAAPAAATRGRRHSAALANVSPAQVHA